MGLFDYLPPMEVKCPYCDLVQTAKPQTKNFMRALDSFGIDDKLPHDAYGNVLCSGCKELFYVYTILDKDNKLENYKIYKDDICPYLVLKSDCSWYSVNCICKCKDGKINAYWGDNHVCACENHDTNGKHCDCSKITHKCQKENKYLFKQKNVEIV